MDLHGQIMKLPQTPGLQMVNATEAQLLAYKIGHRDARHAAAELASEYQEAAEDMRKEVERCFDIAQALDAMNPTLSGAFTGTPSERIQRQLDAMAETL
jgi:hypothetical protein